MTSGTFFVSCEDALPPIAGLFNGVATLTAVPLMAVPLHALVLARRLDAKKDPMLTSLLTCFCVTLTCLFSTNLMQHAVGGLSAVRAHEAMAAVQALFNAATLNAVRRRSGFRSIPDEKGLAVALAGTVAVAHTALAHPTKYLEPVCGVVQLLTSPLIVGTMGICSWRGDARAWRLFVRSCFGLVLIPIVVGIEKHMCGLGSPWLARGYHAVVDHSAIWCLFGGVGQNAVHLVGLSLQSKRREA